MWAAALDALLISLRYLAPATLLTLFWGQQSFLFRILKHIDSAFRAIVFSSEEQKQEVLKWLAEASSVRVEHLDTVWRHGWILCGVLDAMLPGACAGHPPTRLSLKHAQAIADHYLGVDPVFSRSELESNDSLSRHQEWKLASYLARIREALSKLTPPVSKPTSPRTSPESSQITLDYAAKGPGLIASQVNNKMFFKIYPTAQQTLDPGEITILIKGPKDTYGMTVLPPVFGKAQLIRQKLLGLQSKPNNYTESILPTTQGATYLRSYGKNDMNKTYYIPKTKYDIDIEAEFRPDHVKIIYLVALEGQYEISITSRGLSIVGSPFSVKASKNILEALQTDSFCLDDGEEIDIVDIKTDRKVVLRIVDFVTEKMLLRENGTLEQISEDEAKILMATKPESDKSIKDEGNSNIFETYKLNNNKFSTVAQKILKMNQVCRTFNNLMLEKHLGSNKAKNIFVDDRNQLDIPDIVNSTFTEHNSNQYGLPANIDKYIIPENITVSLRTERSKSLCDKETINDFLEVESNSCGSEYVQYDQTDDDNISIDKMAISNNPFHGDFEDNLNLHEKDLGTFVATEYETNNSQNEETRDSSIKIIIDRTDSTPSPLNNNPFLDDVINLERPKSPVYKIVAGEKICRDGPVYFNPKAEISDEEFGNEFINPFFVHQHSINDENQIQHDRKEPEHHEKNPVTDFIIGAPVSLPPMLRSSSPLPDLKCGIMTRNENLEAFSNQNNENNHYDHVDNIPPTIYSDRLNDNLEDEADNTEVSTSRYSLESNLTMDISNASSTSDNQFEPYRIGGVQSNRNVSPRKDTWDSAYVSIDESNSSPDSNNNENVVMGDVKSKEDLQSGDTSKLKPEDYSNMGPAEREIWNTCCDLKNDNYKVQEEIRSSRWEIKRPMFTPIIEETDRCTSSAIKDLSRAETHEKHSEADSVSVAFAELNDLYQEYFPLSESSSTIASNAANILDSDANYVNNTRIDVDSASDMLSDVKRQIEPIEGTISEVQANVTESTSVSQPLHSNRQEQTLNTKSNNVDETQFGDSNRRNIVLERKKYWDEKIRQIEAKTEELAKQQKKKRVSSKQLKHNDSLSKRKGKQVIKNFLNAGESQIKQAKAISNVKATDIIVTNTSTQASLEPEMPDENLVEKWKKYWDNKLVTEGVEAEAVTLQAKFPKSKEIQQYEDSDNAVNNDHTIGRNISTTHPVKQELPEEVFKAFETSPKRFFGTSRKHILSKIDIFLGNPNTEEIISKNVRDTSHDSGLVSSRISMFHKISNTEQLAVTINKSQQNVDDDNKVGEKEKISFQETNCKINDTTNVNMNKKGDIVEPFENTSSANIQENIGEIKKAVTLTEKRARLVHKIHGSVDGATDTPIEQQTIVEKSHIYTKKNTRDINKPSHVDKYKKGGILRKSSISKSDMDIFNKAKDAVDDNLDKYKSCDELPKISVKNFISLYENVSKTTLLTTTTRIHRTQSTDSQKLPQTISMKKDAADNLVGHCHKKSINKSTSATDVSNNAATSRRQWLNKSLESVSVDSVDTNTTDSFEIVTDVTDDKETTYTSLSDIEIEIVENSPEKPSETIPEKTVEAHIEYKSRFKMAKQFFQSLEELREENRPRKLNECEILLHTNSTESLENERPQKRVKKNIKSHSMPSSEISKIWNQMQGKQDSEASTTKLVKISEKFNVDDLFNDVMEGRLSRQGSLRGIPHKNAVLEAFRSMENVAATKLSPYEYATTQLSDFAQENQIKNAQTYLSEYPYLPTTDPSKYHSRLDIKASGLISFKELLERKPRRNSVPDLRLNFKFSADL